MEPTKCMPSVIAKLMGLDDQPPQRPVLKRQRVLSENYLEKSAMLCIYERRPYSGHSSSIATSKQKSRRNTPSSDKELSWTKVSRNTPSFPNGSSIVRLDGKRIFDKWRKTKTAEATKPGDVKCSVGEILISIAELANTKSCKQSTQCHRKLRPGNSFGSIGNNYLKGEKALLSDINGHYDSSATPKASQNIIESGSDSLVFGKLCHEEPDIVLCHNTENDNTHGPVICRLSSDLDRDSDIKSPLEGGQVIHNEKESYLEKNDLLAASSLVKSIPSYISETMAGGHQRNESVISPSEVQRNDCPLEVRARSTLQTSPYYFNEEGLDISDFTRVDSEFPTKSRDINQSSPNSVLEPPLLEENTLASEGYESAGDDFCGLALQFHGLNSKSEETYSEGSELFVSSDEDSEEISHFSNDTGKLLELHGTTESRNFSYLLDILDEAEFTCIKSEHYLKAWHSLDYPVDLSIFEVLEKKYGKQTSWEKSERRLLFDRINVVLKEILIIQIGICSFGRPLRRISTGTLSRNELEEEIWMFLTSEEKDTCNNLATKGLGNETKWLQLSEDIQNICRDIEYDLFNEIAGEIVTIAGF